jgi:hypothetical protein
MSISSIEVNMFSQKNKYAHYIGCVEKRYDILSPKYTLLFSLFSTSRPTSRHSLYKLICISLYHIVASARARMLTDRAYLFDPFDRTYSIFCPTTMSRAAVSIVEILRLTSIVYFISYYPLQLLFKRTQRLLLVSIVTVTS